MINLVKFNPLFLLLQPVLGEYLWYVTIPSHLDIKIYAEWHLSLFSFLRKVLYLIVLTNFYFYLFNISSDFIFGSIGLLFFDCYLSEYSFPIYFNTLAAISIPAYDHAKIKFTEPIKQRAEIRLETEGKIGIYCWVNKTNGNCYVGSSRGLYKRISNYFQSSYILSNPRLTIIHAFKKYGFSSFSLVVLEYCSIETITEREQYWIDLLEPPYNMQRKAYALYSSSQALKSINRTGSNNSFYGKSHTPENKALLREAALKRPKDHRPGIKVEITDLNTDLVIVCKSMREASRSIGTGISSLSDLKKKIGFNKSFIFKERYSIIFIGD